MKCLLLLLVYFSILIFPIPEFSKWIFKVNDSVAYYYTDTITLFYAIMCLVVWLSTTLKLKLNVKRIDVF